MKKFFSIGMAAILGASLSFFACESPTNGEVGGRGHTGDKDSDFLYEVLFSE